MVTTSPSIKLIQLLRDQFVQSHRVKWSITDNIAINYCNSSTHLTDFLFTLVTYIGCPPILGNHYVHKYVIYKINHDY